MGVYKRCSCMERLSWFFFHTEIGIALCCCSKVQWIRLGTSPLLKLQQGILSTTATYNYMVTKGSDKTEPCCYIDHRSYNIAATRFHTPYRRQIKIESSSFGPLCDRRNENQSTLFVFTHQNGHRSYPSYTSNREPQHVDADNTLDNCISLSYSQKGHLAFNTIVDNPFNLTT